MRVRPGAGRVTPGVNSITGVIPLPPAAWADQQDDKRPDYAIGYVAGTLTVIPAPLTIAQAKACQGTST